MFAFFASAFAADCTAADQQIWDEVGSANFQGDEKSCAMRCGGQNPCTGNCMSNMRGYTHDCGQCFGGLSSCVVAHCVISPGNCGINPNGASCKQCTDSHCTEDFESCTGFETPSLSDEEQVYLAAARPFEILKAAEACADYCKWEPPAAHQYDPNCQGCPALILGAIDACAAYCQWVPVPAQQYDPNCAGCPGAGGSGGAAAGADGCADYCQWEPVPVQQYDPNCQGCQ